ncbi:Sugar phosphate isomerase/epimerase [Pedobacter nyackensis]|uniref:Sugar phosphate isomerase/epimerase n=2 Tax=Pedobacter nyackensis TaxID=475255 RepID=A0A1W2F2R7_9SPHI|nr:Sugar phosphate isomerase/epimerase [Pedobacter nyackensis]
MNQLKLSFAKYLLNSLALLFMLIGIGSKVFAQKKAKLAIYDKKNLIAWCIVPFDSKKRGPEERAEMLKKLGINKLAYDWRDEHIPVFDKELKVLKENNIKLQGFWFASGPNPEKDKNLQVILDMLKRNKAKTQLWCTFWGFDQESQIEKVKTASVAVGYVAGKLAEIGCSLGLYNHGGWFGEPENQVQIIDYLKMPNIGIVYNFSHSEHQIDRFSQFYPKILPHLYAINLTGLKGGIPATVVPVGEGNMEEGLMRTIMNSSYKGPIGIINESFAPDAEDGLMMNMKGIKEILEKLKISK